MVTMNGEHWYCHINIKIIVVDVVEGPVCR